VQPRDQDRRLQHGVGRPIEPQEWPADVGRNDCRIEAEPFSRIVHRRHLELVGQAGLGQHKPRHGCRRTNRRLLGESAGDNSGQHERIVGQVKHTDPCPQQVGGGLAGGKGPEQEPAEAARKSLRLIHARAHRGQMHLAVRIDGGDESFEDHGMTAAAKLTSVGDETERQKTCQESSIILDRGSAFRILRFSMHIHFITGRLAEHSLRQVLLRLAPRVGFEATVQVMPITVAALMPTPWIARRLEIPPGTDRVIIPGGCRGSLEAFAGFAPTPVDRGPEDLRSLDEFFGQKPRDLEGYGRHDIEIIAEINHAPRLDATELLAQARRLVADGADRIDIGCDPGSCWTGVGDAVRMLVGEGLRVSIDSFDGKEVAAAVQAGATLVLSVNSANVEAAADWGCEVVAIPDVPDTLENLEQTIERLAAAGVPYRIDPILEPIGFGFAASLGRYLDVRRRHPAAEMMMGIGNLTELTDTDSAGINTVLIGFCQEVGIRSVLTTEVIHWAASSVRECALARALAWHAVTHRTLPKHVEPRLVTLRSGKPQAHGPEVLDQLAAAIRDPNFRVFAERGMIHLVGAGIHLQSRDPFTLFDDLQASGRTDVDPSHAFYLGYEVSKAVTALTLGKDYRQDQPLDWGFLTQPEVGHGPSQAAARVAGVATPAEATQTS
jgi:dihydropteroate synthase